ncbi:MAG: transglycosylase SLT domain-containing protein [bacterium]
MKRLLSAFLLVISLSASVRASDSSLKAGYEAFLAKNYDSAVSLLKGSTVSKSSPLIDYQLWALGKSQVETGDFDGALKSLEELVRLDPKSLFAGRAQANIGRAYFEKGDAAKAKEYFKSVVPSLPDEAKGEALFYWGLAEMGSGEREAGLAHLKESYVKYPASPVMKEISSKVQEEALSFPASDMMTRGDRLFAAKSFLEASKAYESASDSTDASLKNAATVKKGESLYALKRNGDSALYLSAASGPGVTPEVARSALLHLGVTQQKAGDSSQARVTFERVQKNYPGTAEGEEALYRIGSMALDNGNRSEAEEAFKRLSQAYPHGNFRDKGLWSAGWAAYRAREWEKALAFFADLEKGAADFPTAGKGIYWQARVYEKQGNGKKAKEEFLRAAQVSPYSYYGFLGLKRAKGAGPVSQTPEVPIDWKGARSGAPKGGAKRESADLDPHFRKALALYRADMGKQALGELQAAIKLNEGNSEALFRLLEEAKKTDAYFIPVLLGQKYWDNFKSLFPDGRAAEDYRTTLQFPYAFRSEVERTSREQGVPAAFIVGLMRQESAFQPWVSSSANAQGLMQLLPATARNRARSIGGSVGDLFDPSDNIRLGTAELKALLDRFGGNWIYAIAGYNAGPGRPPQWAAQNGGLDEDEFVEEIPFAETNLYVKLVLRNYWTYQTLYR